VFAELAITRKLFASNTRVFSVMDGFHMQYEESGTGLPAQKGLGSAQNCKAQFRLLVGGDSQEIFYDKKNQKYSRKVLERSKIGCI
jgi:hypothetical protein